MMLNGSEIRIAPPSLEGPYQHTISTHTAPFKGYGGCTRASSDPAALKRHSSAMQWLRRGPRSKAREGSWPAKKLRSSKGGTPGRKVVLY